MWPYILRYHITLWTKEAGQPAYVLWHQDGAYFFLEPAEQVTAWVALSDAPVEAGCMHVLPGSHTGPWRDHVDDDNPNNMIKRGQGIPGLDAATGEPMPLKAGEMSLHHTKLIHASGANNHTDRRIGVGLSYIPAHVQPYGDPQPTALRVRGRDHGHFIPETRLATPESPEARAAHRDGVARFRARQDAGSKVGRTQESA